MQRNLVHSVQRDVYKAAIRPSIIIEPRVRLPIRLPRWKSSTAIPANRDLYTDNFSRLTVHLRQNVVHCAGCHLMWA